MTLGFQTQVNVQPAPAMPGDFASKNPVYTYDAGPGGLVAGASGVKVGGFAWITPPLDANSAPQIANSFGTGPVVGFVHREYQALITQYLGQTSNVVPTGFGVTLVTGADLWVTNGGTGEALWGQKAYANLNDGSIITFAPTGSPTGATASSWSISAQTATFTGSIAGNVLTTSGAVTGTIYPGSILSGGTVASNTAVGAQISGTPGGAGTYYVSIPEQTVASASLTSSYGLLTLTTVTAGTFGVGDTLTGATAGVTAGTTITNAITGTGGSGSTFAVNLSQTSSSGVSGVLTAALNVETKWIAMSAGAPGELIKISNHPLG